MQKLIANRTSRASSGFTLIELMITLAIAALLLGIAVPNFRDMSIRNRLAGYNNEIIAAINYARSEAVRRGTPVSICPSNNQASCSGGWNDGWIVFSNPDGDSPPVVGNVADVLKVYDAVADGYSLGADAALAGGLTYGGDGAAANTGVIAFCYQDEAVGARAVVVTRLRPRVAIDTNNDRIPNRDDGANISSCSNPSGA